MHAVMVQSLLLLICLLLFLPSPSSAALPTFETLPPVTDHLKLPSGVAIGDDEAIHVIESNLNQMHLFNRSGVYQRSLYGLDAPVAVAVGVAGEIYIANVGKGNVEVYAPDFSPVGKLGQGDGEFQKPVGIAVDSAGLIYVVDGREHRVKIYNADRSFKSSFGSMGTGNGQFQTPTAIVINEVTSEILIPDLVALSTSARVQVFDLNGVFLRSFITTGTNEQGETVAFIRPYGIAVDTLDRIYVTDGYQNVVTVYNTHGNYLGKLYDSNRLLRNPQGIAFAPGTSRLFVASLNSGTVETYGIDNVYGNIAASPPSHDFGTLAVNAVPISQSFELSNDGSGNLAVGAVTLTGADASEFSIIANDCAERTLAPAAGCTIDVQFQPLTAGSKSASLSVASDDLYLPEMELALSGSADPQQYRLTISKNERTGATGVVQASGINCGTTCSAEYAEGTVVTLSALPDGEAVFVGWSGGGCSGTAACAVAMNQAVTVTATFDFVVSAFADTYSITASAGANGSISPAGTATYDAGASMAFAITADAGYSISDVLVDGGSVGAVGSYNFENIAADHTIAAEFTAISDTLLLSSIEMGEVGVGDQWQRVEFSKSFVDPVVVIKPASLNDPSPAVVRVRNVGAQGFEVRIQEWEYLEILLDNSPAHAEEQVGYVVMERGSYMLEDGTRIEAGWFDTNTTSSFGTISFAQPFTVPPVVISSVVTYNDEGMIDEAAVIGRMGNIDATGFGYMLQEQGVNGQTHVTERASFIAWEPSQGTQSGISFEVGRINDVLTQQPRVLEFSGYQSPPLLIADLQTTHGGTVNLRWSDKSATEVSLLLDQEESNSAFNAIPDKEFVPPTPSTEGVGYLILWSADLLPQTLTVEKTGQGSGLVQAQGIDCGAGCSSSYSKGTEVTLTAVAESGSYFAGWSGGGCSGTASCVVTLDQAVTVTAQFDVALPVTYTITATAGPNGSITPQGETVVNEGATQGYSIAADAGYHIVDVTVDGVSRGAVESYQFVELDRNHEISATFAVNMHLLTVERTGLGSGSVQTQDIDCGADCSRSYSHGAEVTLIAVAESGSLFAGWSGGCSGTTSCVVTLDQAVTVTAQFDVIPPVTYTITATAGSNGSITPLGETVVEAGATQTYSIVADAGYHIANVIVDDEAKGIMDSFRFKNIAASHSISVTFASSVFKLTDIAMGEVSVGHSWKPVTLDRFFADPIVVAKPASQNEVDPAVVRIRNVTTRGFELKIQEWEYLDGEHADERVNYIVMERGNHVLNDGTRIEAGQFEASNTDAFESVLFVRPKAVPPVILSSVVSYNEEDAVTGRIKEIDEEGFQYLLQEQADGAAGHATETVSYIAWEASIGRQDGISFEVSCRGDAEVQQFQNIGFISSYAPSLLFVADLQTAEGSQAVNLRWRGKDKESIEVLIDQERSQPSESTSASVEEIGYLVLSEQADAFCTSEPGSDCDRDGLTDEDEINIYGTDPYLANTDGDFWDDGREVNYWMGRWDHDDDNDGVINLLDIDSNGDGDFDGSAFAGNKSVKARGCGGAAALSKGEGKGEASNSRAFNREQRTFDKRSGFDAAGRTFQQRPGFDSPAKDFDQDGTSRGFNREQRTFKKPRGFAAPERTFQPRSEFRAPVSGFDRQIDFD